LIYPDNHLSSNHAPLTITIPIADEIVSTSKSSIPQNSKQEITFVKEVILIFKNLDMFNLINKNNLEHTVNHVMGCLEHEQFLFSFSFIF